jgi:hypothetical protein
VFPCAQQRMYRGHAQDEIPKSGETWGTELLREDEAGVQCELSKVLPQLLGTRVFLVGPPAASARRTAPPQKQKYRRQSARRLRRFELQTLAADDQCTVALRSKV